MDQKSMMARSGALAVLLALAGCAPSASAGHEGLEIAVVEAKLDRLTVDATSEQGGARIELRRGAPRVHGFTGDVKVTGNYEGDSLVTDSQGHAFFAAFGGHGPVDETWMGRLAKVQGDFDIEQRKRDLVLTSEVAEKLAVDEAYDFELRRLARELAVSARESLEEWNRDGAPTDATAIAPDDELPVEGESNILEKAAALYVHQINVRRSTCCVNFGDHSSTRLRVFNANGGLVTQMHTANHGDFYFAPGMSDAASCPQSFSRRTNQLPPYVPHAAIDLQMNGGGFAGGCRSPYRAVPPTVGGHVCNDDSLAQITNVANNQAREWLTCTDTTLRTAAPACTARTN